MRIRRMREAQRGKRGNFEPHLRLRGPGSHGQIVTQVINPAKNSKLEEGAVALPAPVIPPRVGMMAVVRHRPALITSVQEFQVRSGAVSRLVGVEYLDADGNREDQLLWEREPVGDPIQPRSLPNVEAAPPMPLADFDAVERKRGQPIVWFVCD
jgi:hypothetical protein